MGFLYDFSGVYYQMLSDCIVYISAGVVFLLMSKFWKKTKRNNKMLVLGMVGAALTVVSIAYYSHAINQAKVLMYEGYFSTEHRASKHIMKNEYVFLNEEGLDAVFYLDVLSKKKIYPKEFSKQTQYRIFYEKETNYIVKVEAPDLPVLIQ